MILLDRRTLLGASAAAWLLPRPAFAQGTQQGFRIDWQGGPETPEVAASLAAQIALVKALRIRPEIAAFFAEQVITVDLAADTHTRAGARGVFFERKPMPPDNPVLLHELLHRYHLLKLPDGFRNARILAFYETAKSQGYPASAYMLKNAIEFFAMMTSVVLHGRAARPPFLRANVHAKSPAMYDWIVAEFGLEV